MGQNQTKISLDDAHKRIDDLSKQDCLSNDEISEVYDLIAKLECCGNDAGEARRKATSLLDAESSRRLNNAGLRHEILLTRALAGEKLTEEEAEELRKTAEILSWEH